MAICFSILAWKIPWTEEPEGLQSMGSQRFRHKRAHTHSNKQTGFLSSVSHSSKSMEIKEGKMGTSDLELLGQKHS